MGMGRNVLKAVAGCLAVVSGTLGVPAAAGRPVASSAAPPGVHSVSLGEAEEAGDYWTQDRMEQATPEDAVGVVGERGVRALHFRGVGNVGALFYRGSGRRGHFCTASVVHSARRDLLLTAGHCVYGGGGYRSQMVFVPRYSAGQRPLGTWKVRTVIVDRRWARSLDQDLDFGFVTLWPSHGKRIEDLVPGNTLGTEPGFHNYVRVIGYPKFLDDPADTAIYCRNWTSRAARFQLRFDCDGYAGGTSGSPWLLRFDGRTNTGQVIGVIGGYQGGGWKKSVSYSSYFDRDIKHLYDTAQRLP